MSPENSEYIYAVEEDALSSRFKTGGINAKPFGMYVLSSSTGSIDGASLPTNIQISDLYRIYENINETTHLDLDDIKLNQLILPDENNHDSILYKYKNMFQLSYNNKSEILAEDENSTPKIAELVLDDPTGNSPRLSGGIIDRTTSPQTITYNVSQSAFNNLNQVNYEVVYSELSKGATLGSVESSTTPWDWNISYPFSGNQAKKIIRVYSEININGGLAGKYYTDYEIIINVSNINLNMDAVISVDNSQENVSQISDSYIFNTSLGTMSPNGHITALFSGYGLNDNQRNQMDSLIANGHNLVVKGVYIDSIDPKSLIDPEFYSIDLISKGSINTNANQFGFKVTLSDQLKTGDYLIEYSYYETSVNKTIKFTKRESTNIDFIDMYYDYFSSDENNENYDFVRTNELEFTTYIEFGYLFSDILNVNQRYNLNVDIINKNNYEDYVYDFDISHYNLSLNGMELLTNIQISPFATINSASMEFEYSPNGLRKYILRYFVEPESGTELEVKQTIIERELTNTNVYLDDNLQTSNNFKVTREAILSQIRVDFNLLDSDMYNQIIMHVNNDIHKDNDEVYIIDNDDEYLFGITYIQDPGSYTYNFIIERDSVPYTLGEVIILKDKGVSAYLIDVKYEGLDGGTIFKYPTINPTDEFGNVIDNYDTRFYPGGIDYLDLEGQVYNFKINSEVSDIDLEHYSPGFILPYGARIQRLDRLNGWTMPTSDVNDDSLKTDYIGFDDFSEEVITYRVIPEENADGDYSNSVTYFISAEDMEYNLTIRFKIYYRDPVLGIIDANSENSPIKNNIVLINLMNLKLDQVYPVVGDGNLVANYPNLGSNSFTGINNQSSLYYFLNKDKDVNYRFGRNKTGAYNFNILSPRYLGTETSDLKPNERYKYSMFMVPKDSNNNNWDNSENQLPAMNDYLSDSSGLFYYVYSPTTNPITRELAIVINPETVDKKWGIYDDYGSFN